ncbi:metallophosphoesterase family protein [Leptothermofonsia sp. ETS-13]|uniref:metallophosphoesterase family protein n=1 Tax=Leptothermofonsia sp. ETS-13 TaxID=3035696 RepID=UPI003B9E6CBC
MIDPPHNHSLQPMNEVTTSTQSFPLESPAIASPPPSRLIKIAIVGDVHNQWDADDEIALKYLGVDLVLLVGDFGNEAIEVVQQIAALSLPKAVVLGNHDAWYTATPLGSQTMSLRSPRRRPGTATVGSVGRCPCRV